MFNVYSNLFAWVRDQSNTYVALGMWQASSNDIVYCDTYYIVN